ncbi:MAG: hypothetical protein VX684_02315, partial [Planctomycetota bacterium]|nr:hypothetical protein [Planctomycetota bacterium]
MINRPFQDTKKIRPGLRSLATVTVCVVVAGCQSDAEWVDQRLDRVLDASSDDIGGDSRVPDTDGWMAGAGNAFPPDRLVDNHPPTDNPPAEELRFKGQSFTEADADQIIERMT